MDPYNTCGLAGVAYHFGALSNLRSWAMVSIAVPGGEDGEGGAATEHLPPGTATPDSKFHRRRLPVVPVAIGCESWSFSPGAPAAPFQSAAAYITPDPVLWAPGNPGVDGHPAPAVHGCLWPPGIEVVGSSDINTPAGEEVHTHVSSATAIYQNSSFFFLI